MSQLPKGWAKAKLPQFAEIIMGQSPASSDCNDIGDGIPFFQGKAEFQELYPEVRKYCTKPKKLAQKDDILLSVRAPVGPTNLAPAKCSIGRGLSAIRAYEQADRYLLLYLRSIEPWTSQQGTGSTFKAISGQFLKDLEVRVAPLTEQNRIVEKLDEVLAQVDTIKARLDGIPAILKRFRQSVLASAVSGKLTEEWRGECAEDTSWKQITLKEAAHIQDPHPSHRTPPVVEDGIPFVSIGDLREDGSIDIENARKVSPDVLKEHNARYTLKEGDFIFGKIGTLGKATVLPIGVDFALSANVILIQPEISLADPKYIQYFLSSPTTMEEVAKQANSTSQAAFGIKKMRAFVCSLPKKSEQKEIVRLVDQYFAFAYTIEAQVKKAQARVDKLTQSILAKAFRGELVAQDPNDEPADKLLERIAAARAEADALAKTAKKVGRKQATA